ncbi:NET1-associated nuclear protein 1 (U3 small nucleolar RNA-associated protein 17), partial [Lecanoromycetidae sp. Uapishka_2]
MGPESNTIQEPDVTHLQVSYDGQWLVSVDEWMPPKEDVASLSFDQDHMKEEQFFRREIHLKFWSWNNNTKTWELVSRVDNPHSSRSGNPYNSGRVLDLTSDPSSAGFATIGEDGIVKTWKPAIRRRNGLEVRNKNGKILGTWHCKHSVPLESSGPIAPNSILGAKLAYSRDGSILAGGLQSSTPCPIYTIDTYSGEVKSVQTGLYSGPLFGLGIVNKYLVTLSHELCVWDLISDQRQYGVKLRPNSLSQVKQLSMTHLAADADNGLFALAIPEVSAGVNETIIKSRMAVFDPTSPTPLLLASLPSSVTNLLSDTRRKAFYAIDSAAEVRTLAPSAKFSSIQNDLLNETRQASRGLRDIFGNGQNLESIEDGMDKRAGRLGLHFETLTRKSELHEDDAVVVSQDKLSEVFEVGPAYAMPPVAELFEQVASLYGGQGSS